jgi:tRNA (guanine-N7-)-methyltransferase
MLESALRAAARAQTLPLLMRRSLPATSHAPKGPPSPGEWVPADYFHEARLADIFPSAAPLELDLGCGDGTFLVEMAQRHPERNYLGTERLLGRVEKVARKIARAGLANARVVRHESHYVIRSLLPRECASVVYVLHPDPWPKRHHHPRRIIQLGFMESVHRVLRKHGEVRIKTDDLPYFRWMEKVFAECAHLFERVEWEQPPDWPQTDFERECIAKGLPIYQAELKKV